MNEIRVLLLNGSPRANGNTALALREMEKVFAQNGVQTETVLLGNQAIRGCTACGACAKLGRCVFDDAVNELAPKLEAADGLVVASPVYYASANATLIACLDRLFYSTPFDKTMKVGASVVCARRGGCSATFERAEQIFHHFRYAHCLEPVLEQRPRQGCGRGGDGRRGLADYADACAEHDVPDEKHRARPRDPWPARAGGARRDALHPVKQKSDRENGRFFA